MTVTSAYAAVLAVVFCALSFRTLALRRTLRVALGDGADATLQRATRAHANFAEYVPLALVLMLLLELGGRPAAWIHALGAALGAGRALHAWGASHVQENYRYRVSGMVLTLGMTALAATDIMILHVFPA